MSPLLIAALAQPTSNALVVDTGGGAGTGVCSLWCQFHADGTITYPVTGSPHSNTGPTLWGFPGGGSLYLYVTIDSETYAGWGGSNALNAWTAVADPDFLMFTGGSISGTPGTSNTVTGTWRIASDAAGANILRSGTYSFVMRTGTT